MLLLNTSSAYLSVIHREVRRQTELLFCSRNTTEITEAQLLSRFSSNGLAETAPSRQQYHWRQRQICWSQLLVSSLPHTTKQSFLLLGTNTQHWTKDDIPFLAVKQRMQLKIRNQNASERVGFSLSSILMTTAPQTSRDFQMRSALFGQLNEAVGFLEHKLLNSGTAGEWTRQEVWPSEVKTVLQGYQVCANRQF